jgi:hypothetical protein
MNIQQLELDLVQTEEIQKTIRLFVNDTWRIVTKLPKQQQLQVLQDLRCILLITGQQ